MPELPEVEIVRRGLEPLLVGARFERVEQRRPDLRFPLPRGFQKRLEGRSVRGLARRGKYLLAHLCDDNVLVMHLGMTGRFTVSHNHRGGGDPRHDHVVFHMSSGASLTYNDPRRFGFMLLIGERALDRHPLIKDLGVEPLGNELTAAYLARRARGKTVSLKGFLADQRIVAGLGNIYISEALFRAALSPNRRAASLAKANGAPSERAERLVPAIRAVLQDAIAAGGSTLRDYRKADGELGEFQHSFAVYGREGKPCVRAGCRGIVRRSVQGGRSTFFCPTCQR